MHFLKVGVVTRCTRSRRHYAPFWATRASFEVWLRDSHQFSISSQCSSADLALDSNADWPAVGVALRADGAGPLAGARGGGPAPCRASGRDPDGLGCVGGLMSDSAAVHELIHRRRSHSLLSYAKRGGVVVGSDLVYLRLLLSVSNKQINSD